VVSHDSYFHSRYAIRPDGSKVEKNDPKEYLFTMPYDSIAKYDVGSRESTVWPGKACFPAVKPLAKDLFEFVEQYTKEKGYSPVRYNVEVKSSAKSGEGTNWANYDALADACCKLFHSLNLGDRLVIQCFDHRALNYMHEKYPEFKYSYLVSVNTGTFEEYMAKLNFVPTWLSPHHSITDAELVRKCHEMGMKIVPWTADEPEDIQRLIDLKVEAIITNYPDRLLKLTRGYVYPVPADKK
jgi:glycerophosphoryl diester phosphodiesterase